MHRPVRGGGEERAPFWKGPLVPPGPGSPREPPVLKEQAPPETWHFRLVGLELLGGVSEIPILISASSRTGAVTGACARFPLLPSKLWRGKRVVWTHISPPPLNTHLKTNYFPCNSCSLWKHPELKGMNFAFPAPLLTPIRRQLLCTAPWGSFQNLYLLERVCVNPRMPTCPGTAEISLWTLIPSGPVDSLTP